MVSAVTSSVSWRSFSLIVGLVWCKEFLCFADNLSLRSVCPFVSVCCCSVRIFTSKRNAPSLRAPRAETRLTVYRALRSSRFCAKIFGKSACTFEVNLPRCCANKMLLFDRKSNLRLYEPYGIVLKSECTLPGA